MAAGKLIVIEGSDGSGKATQCALLVDRLRESGHDPLVMDFPRYEEPSAFFVKKYLNGGYGTLRDSGPKRAALFYALDRFDASPAIWEALRAGRIVISNRYVASSMGHQGSKIEDAKEQQAFFEWLYDLEYGIFGIPKPAINIFLHVPSEVSYDLIAKKAERKYLEGGTRDIAESDKDHLKKAEETYRRIAGMFPEEFLAIECSPGGRGILPPGEIHEKVWTAIQKFL